MSFFAPNPLVAGHETTLWWYQETVVSVTQDNAGHKQDGTLLSPPLYHV